MRITQDCFSGADQPLAVSAVSERHRQPAPLSAEHACATYIQRGELAVSRAGVFWLQTDPSLGANTLWRLTERGPERFGPEGLSVRSRVNGYGGGALAALDTGVFLVSEQQQVHFLELATGVCHQLTDERGAAFGGLVADPHRHRVLAVREGGGRQQLVAVSLEHGIQVLHAGQDFYGAPALSTDGRHIAWVSWQLPDMPWLSTTLWTAVVTESGWLRGCETWPTVSEASVQQPVYAGTTLWVLSDHGGWWQPWRLEPDGLNGDWVTGDGPSLDHASAPWQLGESHHVPLAGHGWARVHYRGGTGELWLYRSGADQKQPESQRVAPEFSDFRCLGMTGRQLYCIARSSARLDAVLRVDPDTGQVRVMAGGESALHGQKPVLPLTFEVPAVGDNKPGLHGFFYEPTSSSATTAPPLILVAHGGPTSAAYPVFNPQVQYWCQRGFAVAEVNYRGSSGFGRSFRLALAGQWGEADVEDMERTADHLSSAGLVDGRRIFIQGRSSGGYTALMALIRSRRFAAGASMFGVTDPLRLREATHRFESGYLDWLIGAPQQHPERWRARTPLYLADRIRAPVIFFQGGRDQVVVPEQTRAMIASMQAVGLSPELHWFEEEGHGFRYRTSQVSMLVWLFSFYRRQSVKINEQGGNLR
ncbi:alpha/beta hydrolase family protein [Marinobacter sp. GN3S48]|uniref:alpha/beta hydrolase family protein n=1 Tax=Marinobacter sp. GN3S48 TaxID=3382302 RepID=UPI00387A8BF7